MATQWKIYPLESYSGYQWEQYLLTRISYKITGSPEFSKLEGLQLSPYELQHVDVCSLTILGPTQLHPSLCKIRSNVDVLHLDLTFSKKSDLHMMSGNGIVFPYIQLQQKMIQ